MAITRARKRFYIFLISNFSLIFPASHKYARRLIHLGTLIVRRGLVVARCLCFIHRTYTRGTPRKKNKYKKKGKRHYTDRHGMKDKFAYNFRTRAWRKLASSHVISVMQGTRCVRLVWLISTSSLFLSFSLSLSLSVPRCLPLSLSLLFLRLWAYIIPDLVNVIWS